MGGAGLCRLFYYFFLNSPFMICAYGVFIEVPKDVSVREGEDVEIPCAFKALSSAPMSLEIQWWYIKLNNPKETPQELQIGPPAYRAKTVRVQGNAISHRLSLSKVKKENEGVYECRVSDLWAEETQEFTVHATLSITPGGGMVAKEAVSHIQNDWSLRNTNALQWGSAGRATSKPSQRLTGGSGTGQQHWVPQPDHLPSMSSTTTTSVAKSSASQLQGAQHSSLTRLVTYSMMSTMDTLLFITVFFLHNLFILLVY